MMMMISAVSSVLNISSIAFTSDTNAHCTITITDSCQCTLFITKLQTFMEMSTEIVLFYTKTYTYTVYMTK